MKKYILNNNLTVIEKKKNTESVTIQISIKTGSNNEKNRIRGISHFLEHMIFEGTKKREARQIALEVESMGGEINAFTGNERTSFYVSVLNKYFDKGLDVLSDIIRNPIFRDKAIVKEKKIVMDEKKIAVDDPSSYQWLLFLKNLYKKHPTKWDCFGNLSTVNSFARDNVMKFYKNYYVPNNMAICMSGDLDFEKTIKMIDKYWGDLGEKKIAELITPEEEPIAKPMIKEVYGPEAEYMSMAFRFDGYKSEDRKYVELIDFLLNNYQAGLIDLNLVLEQEVLDAGSYSYFMKDYGTHEFYGDPREGQTLEEVKNLILNELEKIKRRV